jgi:small-conductance mechanosensitive channel
MNSSVLWSIGVVIISYIIFRLLKKLLNTFSQRKNVTIKRIYYIEKVFEILLLLITLVILIFIWSVDIKSIALFASSFFAIVGVALFAQWSILSNITASIIIFFSFPARVGDKIKIVDGDNTIEGIINEISLFQIELTDSEDNTVFYPNNLLLQKPVIKVKQPDDTNKI